jgi:Family of unknown function (DUF6494)
MIITLAGALICSLPHTLKKTFSPARGGGVSWQRIACRRLDRRMSQQDAGNWWQNGAFPSWMETGMDEEAFNMSIRKFLKIIGVSSQREIEQAVARAIASGAISGSETFPAKVTLEVAGVKLKVDFDGEIKLQ